MNEPKQLWQEYRDKIYGPLPSQQERECSLSFYAGMYQTFRCMVDIIDETIDEDTAFDSMENLRNGILQAALEANSLSKI